MEGFPRPFVMIGPRPADWLRKAVRLLLGHTPAPSLADREQAGNEKREARTEQYLTEFGGSILRFVYSYLHNQSDAEEVLQETTILQIPSCK